MANGQTAIYAFVLPEDGADFDQWGLDVNTDLITKSDTVIGKPRYTRNDKAAGDDGNIDLSLGNYQTYSPNSPSQNIVIVGTPADLVSPASKYAVPVWVLLDGSELDSLTYDSSITWLSGAQPDLTTTSGPVLLGFLTYDEGTTWYGFRAGKVQPGDFTDGSIPGSKLVDHSVTVTQLDTSNPIIVADVQLTDNIVSVAKQQVLKRCHLVPTVQQAVNPEVDIQWAAGNYNVGAMFSAGDNTKITPGAFTGGVILVGQCQFTSGGLHFRLKIKKTGTVIAEYNLHLPTGGAGPTAPIIQVVAFDSDPGPSDYYTLAVFAESAGGNLVTVADSHFSAQQVA